MKILIDSALEIAIGKMSTIGKFHILLLKYRGICRRNSALESIVNGR
jgi:hypothetical protein